MSKILTFILFIFFSFRLPQTSAYYSLWEQDIFVDKNDHILIKTTQYEGLVSDHILQTFGDVKITLVPPHFF